MLVNFTVYKNLVCTSAETFNFKYLENSFVTFVVKNIYQMY
jgi:hypothetical protein